MEVLPHKMISSFAAFDLDVAETSLGKSGRKAIEFIKGIDLDHPDAFDVVYKLFNSNYRTMVQVHEVLRIAKDYSYLSVVKKLHKLVDGWKPDFKPSFGARLLKSKEAREAVRATRQAVAIDLWSPLQRKGEQFWNKHPGNFAAYEKDNLPFAEDVKELDEKIERYRSLGCTDLAEKFINESQPLKNNLTNVHHGYNRIPVTIASLILAKQHEFKIKSLWDAIGRKGVEVVVPLERIYNFDSSHEDDPTKIVSFGYEPRLYPLHDMLHVATDDITSLIDELDNARLFDDFLILVPGPVVPCSFIRNRAKIVVGYENKQEAARALDTILVEEKYVRPLLLGEKDGKCFYICQWR